MNLFFRKKIQRNIALAVVLSGVVAPFHYILPHLYFSGDKYYLIPNAVPVIICWISFKMGENVGIYFKRKEKFK